MQHFHFVPTDDPEADWSEYDPEDTEWDLIDKGLLVQQDPSEEIGLNEIATCPMGTVFWHECFESMDKSDWCILLSAGDARDGDKVRVRYLDFDGNAKTMWVSDDDSVFVVERQPDHSLALEEIDKMIATERLFEKEGAAG